MSILQYDTPLTRGTFSEYPVSFSRPVPCRRPGVVLVVLTLVAIASERLGRVGRCLRAPSPGRPAGPGQPGQVEMAGGRGVVAVVATGLGVPVGVLGYWASVGSSRGGAGDVLAGDVLAGAATTSVGLAGAVAPVAVVTAIPVALLAVRHAAASPAPWRPCLSPGTPCPGLLIALALVFFAAPYALYQTLSLVVLAYVIRFLPEAIGSVRSSLAQVDPRQ